jgi:multiple sugar transport system permease protein
MNRTTKQKTTLFFRRRSFQKQFSNFIVYALLISLSIVFIIPLLWMVSTAFKDSHLIFANPPIWIPPKITLDNFRDGLRLMLPSFQKLFLNSSIITFFTIVGTLFSSSMVGFAFAVLPARGKKVLFAILLSTLMIPAQVTLIPQFVFFSKLGWRDTWLPLIVPAFFALPFFVFMFRQFFSAIPRDLYDSAELDGCSPLGLYFRLVIPLSKPVFATAGIFALIGAWNDLMNPLIYLSDMDKFTLTLGIANFQAVNFTLLQYMMPVALLGLLPLLILFFIAQRYFIQGIVTTGMKG